MGIGKFQSSHKIDNSQLINQKVGTIDYVQERTPYTKYGTNPPIEGFLANAWKKPQKKYLGL